MYLNFYFSCTDPFSFSFGLVEGAMNRMSEGLCAAEPVTVLGACFSHRVGKDTFVADSWGGCTSLPLLNAFVLLSVSIRLKVGHHKM